MLRLARPLVALLLVVAAASVSGCASTVSMAAAPSANETGCAEMMVRLPDTLSGQSRRWTDAQSTAAWGDPATVLFTCGVTPPGPTTLRCDTVSGVDWIVDESQAPTYRVTTFGRTPAIELFLDTQSNDRVQGVSSREVLDALSPIVSQLPVDGQCVDREDATLVPDPETTPAPADTSTPAPTPAS